MTHLTHDDRRERRAAIAAAVEAGQAAGEVARSFRVGLSTVYSACVEHSVTMTKQRSRTLRIIAAVQNEQDKSLHNIANDFDVTEAFVHQVVTRAKRAGLRFPNLKKRT